MKSEGLLAGQMQSQPSQQSPLTPDQEKTLGKFIANGMRLIHSEQTRDMVLRRLQVGEPVNAVADATLNIILQVERDAENKGIPVDDDIKAAGASELMSQIIEVGETAGIFEMDEQQIKDAAGQAVGKYFQQGIDSGKIPIEKLQQMDQSFRQEAAREEMGGK